MQSKRTSARIEMRDRVKGYSAGVSFRPLNVGKAVRALVEAGWPVQIATRELSGRRRTVVAAAGVLMVTAAIAFGVVANQARDAVQHRSLAVEGSVESIVKSSRGDRALVRYQVDARTLEAKLLVPGSVKEGAQVALRYDPRDPKVAWMQGDAPPQDPLTTGIILVIPGVCLLWATYRERAVDRLLRSLQQERIAPSGEPSS